MLKKRRTATETQTNKSKQFAEWQELVYEFAPLVEQSHRHSGGMFMMWADAQTLKGRMIDIAVVIWLIGQRSE